MKRSGPRRGVSWLASAFLVAATSSLVPTQALEAQTRAAGRVANREDGAPRLERRHNHADPSTNRLFFAPTARILPAKTWEAGAYQLVLPFVTYAFTDRVMVSGGTPIVPDGFGRLWYVAPKLGLYSGDRVGVAAGGLLAATIGHGSARVLRIRSWPSIAWIVATYGPEDRSVSLGLASVDLVEGHLWRGARFAFAGGEYLIAVRSEPDGEDRRGLKLIGEAYAGGERWWFWLDQPFGTVGAAGLRFFTDDVAAELVALYSVSRTGAAIAPLPFLSLVWRW